MLRSPTKMLPRGGRIVFYALSADRAVKDLRIPNRVLYSIIIEKLS